MASGFGMNGGPGRCFPFWQEVLTCYVSNQEEDPKSKAKCMLALDDYYECLHHRKEAARVDALQAAYRKADSTRDKSNDMTAEQIRKLGVLEGTLEEKHLKPNRFLPHLKYN
ncbi:NADH-ubiquinone oxidoreductase [Pseudovirgaria hyperparasitica]|uniref:NADH dehydrogenase [ubiquinone] iron-sulfur protein 5 n=1 Tax=Pseudovirgaria hyperparasitica TaxID=470096 RepID=A0A6A6W7N2_9PEZI|nr:NADH-ubiquinone oxidoreductase [Pseudovirgaria hyperparasitica]KAF2758034.1 NADH-ubiquinone oxidoreductase [Pseudovirgaria hyperparasitica]